MPYIWTDNLISTRLEELYPDKVIRSLEIADKNLYHAIYDHYGNVENYAKIYGYTIQNNGRTKGKPIFTSPGHYPTFKGLRINYLETLIVKIKREYPEIERWKVVTVSMEVLRNGSYDKQIFEAEIQKRRVS